MVIRNTYSTRVTRMKNKKAHLALAILIFLPSLAVHSSAFAEPCISVRDGTDGANPSGGKKCVEFTDQQRLEAAKLGLEIGSPFANVKTKLARDGWEIDQDWLNLFGAKENSAVPLCGSGLDAVCSLGLRKNIEKIELTFSGTSLGLPLVDVQSITP